MSVPQPCARRWLRAKYRAWLRITLLHCWTEKSVTARMPKRTQPWRLGDYHGHYVRHGAPKCVAAFPCGSSHAAILKGIALLISAGLPLPLERFDSRCRLSQFRRTPRGRQVEVPVHSNPPSALTMAQLCVPALYPLRCAFVSRHQCPTVAIL